MTQAPTIMQAPANAYFRSGGALRSRSVAGAVRHGVIDVPAPPPRVQADWERDIRKYLMLEPGDVEQLSLARTHLRWPGLDDCVQRMHGWAGALGLQEVLASSDIALMACRGARYHHDGEQYSGAVFCNLFLSEDKGLDVHFPGTGQRLALTRGAAMLFDTCQPHAVIRREASGFQPDDFPAHEDLTQVFLTWELPVQAPGVAAAMGIAFDTDTPSIRKR